MCLIDENVEGNNLSLRKVPSFFALMLIGITFASMAKAGGQCKALSTAASNGDSNLVSALIATGMSVNCSYTGSYVKKSTGETVTYVSTPLNDAAYGGFLKTVQLLLSHGANVNLKDGKGHTPTYNADMGVEDCSWWMETSQDCNEVEKVFQILKQAGGVNE